MMPVLSSFIPYRHKRQKGGSKSAIGKISSPLPVRSNLVEFSPSRHPYAAPPILDIHDERIRTPSPPPELTPEPSLTGRPSNDYYSRNDSPPKLDINPIQPSPLGSWFPADLLQSDPFTVNLGEEAPTAGGSKPYSTDRPGPSRLREDYSEARMNDEEDMYEESDDEGDEPIEVDEVLAGMDISYENSYPSEDIQGTPSKRPAPSPIKIPNTNAHAPKVQVLRSAEQSRPTSQISSPESAVSGTSFARALMGNSFFLSTDNRGSKYRSGFSTLTRTDSATLPRGEYGLLNSPYWRGSMASSLASPPPPILVPPVPENADQVYQPPQVERQSAEPKRSRSANVSYVANDSPQPLDEDTDGQQDGDAEALRRISRISETKTSLQSTVQDHQEPVPQGSEYPNAYQTNSRSTSPVQSTSSKGKSRRYSLMPESVRSESDIISDGMRSPSLLSDPPSSGGREDYDNVLDYYQLEEGLEPPYLPGVYRLPFSPITEETSSQLSPPAPYNRPDSRSSSIRTPGRYFFGASPSAATGGVRVDWGPRRSSDARPGSRDSIAKQLLPIGERPNQSQSPNGTTNHNPRPSFSRTPSSPNPAGENRPLVAPPPLNRLKAGNAPSPIQVLRDPRDLNSYTIMVTPRTDDSGEQTASTDSDMLRQDFPETPNQFSPGFSPGPGSVASPRDGSYSAASDGTRIPLTGILSQPSLAQQVLLTRAATSVHGARHSRQASLSKQAKMNGGLPPPADRPISAFVNRGAAGQNSIGSSEETIVEKEESVAGHEQIHSSTSNSSLNSLNSRSQEAQFLIGDAPVVQEPTHATDSVATPPPPPHPQAVPLPEESLVSPEPTVTVAPASPAFSSDTESSTGLAYMHSQPQSTLNSPIPEGQETRRSSGSHYTPLESPRMLPAVPPSPSVLVPPTPPPPPPPLPVDLPSTDASPAHTSNNENAPSPRVERVPIPPSQTIPMPASASPPTRVVATPSVPLPASTTPASSPPAPLPIALNAYSPPSSFRNIPNQSTPMSSSAPLPTGNTPIVYPPIPLPPSNPSIMSPSAPLLSSPLARPPMNINPPAPHEQLSASQASASSLYSYAMDSAPRGSPPPYYSVVRSTDHGTSENVTPTTGQSFDPNYQFGTPHSPPANIGRFTSSSDPPAAPGQGHNSTISPHTSRHRSRPAIPAGPRRPSTQTAVPSLPPSTWATRERNGSVSSVGSSVPNNRRTQPQTLPSPKFSTPSPKFRGYTMDAAKWTFTSAQLQDIVSRAIRQSSEASFIRLLDIETLDQEIPDELDRLQALKSQLKANYKNLSRRRMTLLDSLSNCLDSTDPDAKARSVRFFDDLRDISTNMDKLTEDLNSVNEQLSQVNHITELHSTSALAMAVRKLNGSFLKQFQEAQDLRQQVSSLEAERDEAWKQAEKIAHDYDDLRSGMVDSPDSESKLLRVTTTRKTSVRAIKAGLRSNNRLSSRYSIGSNSLKSGTTPNSARTTFHEHEDIPPVPPIPRRRPGDIKTNLPLRNSVTIATETPNSETRAMVQVTEELYDMLGIPLHEQRSRRSRSVIGLPGEGDQAGSPSYSYYDPPPNTGRRNSLPGSAALPPDAYSNLAADVNIILNSDRSGWI